MAASLSQHKLAQELETLGEEPSTMSRGQGGAFGELHWGSRREDRREGGGETDLVELDHFLASDSAETAGKTKEAWVPKSNV